MSTDEFVDRCHMARALSLAERGLATTHPNPRVGCVLVKEGRVIGEGWHERAGGPHAEAMALQAACEDPTGASCYVTLEPCSHFGRTPPCADALIRAKVRRVVIAQQDPNPLIAGRGITRLRGSDIQVDVGLLAEEARRLNIGFWQRHTTGRPYVRLKLGTSLDGRIAMASGESRWITGPSAREDVHRWRARSAAILTGIGTVLQDNPRLDARPSTQVVPVELQPVRVVIDAHLKLPDNAQLLQSPGKTWIFAGVDAAADVNLSAPGLEVIPMMLLDGRIRLAEVLQELGRREINEVWVEAGASLSGAFLQAALVDEVLVYMAPKILGQDAVPAFRLQAVATLADSLPFHFVDVRQVGKDLRMTLMPDKGTDLCLQA